MIAVDKTLGTSLLERIGNTPLVRLDSLTAEMPGVQILGKAEWMNPGGSVKGPRGLGDCARCGAPGAIENSGREAPGPRGCWMRPAETRGIAYAMLGAALGFPVTLCMPSNVSPERKKYVDIYGAEVVWTNPADGSDGAIRKARELTAAEPERYFYADQYSKRGETGARITNGNSERDLGPQTEGQITHFVAGLGTSGTFVGTTRRFKELNPRIRCISMQPDSPFNGLEGLKHMATAIVPKIYDATLADEDVEMETERAYSMAKRLARTEGLLVGVSAAAAVQASLDVAEREAKAGREVVIVTVLCDSAEKYMSERFWTEG